MNAIPSNPAAPSRLALRALALAGFLFSLTIVELLAQQPSSSASERPGEELETADEMLELNEFVITGSVSPRSKLESSAPITTIDRTLINSAAPRSTAEALKLIPGFYVESSGGENNNNLFARGAPADGGYVFVILQEDGLPVISESDFQFSPSDNYSRITNWVSNIEAVRGGTAGVFQSSAAIGIINLIGREGTQEQRGEVSIETSDYGLVRTQLWTGGPLGSNTTYAVGGFFRVDDGIRSPGFTANKGGQVNANIRYEFPDGRGHLKFSGKILDDRTAFQLPIPLRNPRDPKTIPGGPDIHDGPSGSRDIKRFYFPGTPLGDLDWDLGDGIRVDLSYVGAEFEYELAEGIRLTDRMRYTVVDKAWNANPPGTPATLQSIANSIATSANAGGQFAAALDSTTGNYRFRLSNPGLGGAVVAANAAAAASLNGNGLGMDNNFWHSGAEMENFQNDLRVTAAFNNEATTLSGGVYYAYLKDDRLWQWNTFLTDVTPRYRRLDVTYLDATGAPIGQGTYGGIRQVGSFYRREGGESTDTSLYANLEHRLGDLVVDAGVRREVYDANAQAEGSRTYDLNEPGETNPALRGATFGNGTFTSAFFDNTETAYTMGANYTFKGRAAVFGRYSDGFRMQDLDDVYNIALSSTPADPAAAGNAIKIRQYEIGVKYSSAKLAFFATGFLSKIEGQTFADFIINPDGTTGQVNNRIDYETTGLELEGIWTPLQGLSLQVIGTLQEPEIATDNFVSGTNASGETVRVNIKGNRPVRIPREYGTVRLSYTLPATDWGSATIDGAWQFTGKRFTDLANLGTLDSFSEFSVGARFVTRNGFTFRVHVANLFNSDGLTEGDPRAGQTFADPDAAYSNFRPVLPRSIVGSVTYAF